MKRLTPRVILLGGVACILSLLLAPRFMSIVVFMDACVISLLLPERFVSGVAWLVAAVCIVALGLVVCVTAFYSPGGDLFIRFPIMDQFLYPDLTFGVFLYGLPLFFGLALVAIEKRRLAHKH